MEKKSSILLGLAGSFIGGIVGGILYYILLQVGFIAAITSIVGVIVSCTLFMKLGNRPNVGFAGCFGSIIFNIIAVLVAAYLDILKEIANYFGVSSAEAELIFAESYQDLLKDLDFLKGPILAIIIIVAFSIRYAWSPRGAHKQPKTDAPVAVTQPIVTMTTPTSDVAPMAPAAEQMVEETASKEKEDVWTEATPAPEKVSGEQIEADLKDLETDFVD